MERFTRSFTPLRTTAFLTLFLLCLSLSAAPAFAWSSSQANVSVIGGTGSQTGLQSVLDPSGNIYILGNFTGVTDFDPGDGTFNMTATGTQELFVTKLDSSGSFLWANKFTSQSGSSYSSAGDLTVDSSGNVFVAGAFTSDVDLNPGLDTATVTSAGQVDMFFVKLNSSGAYIWGKRIGGAFNEYVFAIAADSSGNSYYSGCFTYTVDFDPGAGYFGMSELAGNGYTDAYITKLDSSGSFVWAKQLAGNNGGCAYGMSIDPSGNLLQFGNFSSTVDFDPGSGTNSITSSGLEDVYILKLDSAGTYLWAKTTGGAGTERPLSMTTDSSGNILATGYFTGTTDLDPSSNVGSFIGDASYYTEYVFKWDTSGNYLWGATVSPTTSNNTGTSVVTDSSGAVYVSGWFGGTVDFEPGAGVTSVTSAGSNDISLWKLSSNGVFQWVQRIGGSSSDSSMGVRVTGDDKVILTGSFQGTVDFDTGAGTANFVAQSSDTFILKFNSNGLSTFIREASSLGISLSTGKLVASKGLRVSINATVNTSGKITFYADGKKIAGCANTIVVNTSASCSWVPSVRKAIVVSALFLPSSDSFLSTLSSLNISVVSRTGNR